MHMRQREKMKRYIFVLLIVFITVIAVGLISGRINTTEILIVSKNGVDINSQLDQQLEYFSTKEMLESEIEMFKGSVVTDRNQLNGKKLLYPLAIGSPIPLSALTENSSAGQFAASLKSGMTIHKLTEAVNALPPVQVGDVINIAVTFNNTTGDKEALTTGLLMENVKIHTIQEANIYVEVTLEQDFLLSTATQVGTFVYQLPGQADPCANATEDQKCEAPDEEAQEYEVITSDKIIEMILQKQVQKGSTPDKKATIDKVKEGAGSILDDVTGSSETDPDKPKQGGDDE